MGLPYIVGGFSTLFEDSLGILTPTLDSHIADDIILLIVGSTGGAGLSSDQGFQHVASSPSGNLSAFWYRATGTNNTVAPTIADNGVQTCTNYVIRGCPPAGDPWNTSSSGSGAPSAISIPGATTTLANCLVMFMVESDETFASGGFNTPNGTSFLGYIYHDYTAEVGVASLHLYEWSKATAGAYGSLDVTSTPPTVTWSGISIAFRGVDVPDPVTTTAESATITISGADAYADALVATTAESATITISGADATADAAMSATAESATIALSGSDATAVVAPLVAASRRRPLPSTLAGVWRRTRFRRPGGRRRAVR